MESRIQQLAGVHCKGDGQALNVLDRQVPQSPFNGADVRAIKGRAMRQFFLRNALSDSDETNIRREQVLQIERVRLRPTTHSGTLLGLLWCCTRFHERDRAEPTT